MDPELDLEFVAMGFRTHLHHRRVRYPYALTTPLRLDRADGVATVIVQSAAGGLFEADRLSQRIVLREKARAGVTTQGATVVHGMRGEAFAECTTVLRADARSYLEHRPHPLVMFPAARLRQRLTLQLAEGAAAVLSDGFLGHDPAGEGRTFGRLDSAIEVRRPDGSLIAADRIDVCGVVAADGPHGISRSVTAHGWLIAVGPLDRTAIEEACFEIARACDAVPGLYAGASRIRDDEGFFARFAAEGGGALTDGLRGALMITRRALLHERPVSSHELCGASP